MLTTPHLPIGYQLTETMDMVCDLDIRNRKKGPPGEVERAVLATVVAA